MIIPPHRDTLNNDNNRKKEKKKNKQKEKEERRKERKEERQKLSNEEKGTKIHWLELQAIEAPLLCVKISLLLDAEGAGILHQISSVTTK